MSSPKKFLLIGPPNSGKTTLFNRLTGLHQKTANYPGVTVEKYIGTFQIDNEEIELVDLPGIYSLYANAIDEQLSIREICESTDITGLLLVINAENIKISLPLILQVLDLKIPVVLVLNMIDEAKKHKIDIDINELQRLLDIEIVGTNSRIGSGFTELKTAIQKINISKSNFNATSFLEDIKSLSLTNYQSWIAYRLSNSEKVTEETPIMQNDLLHKRKISDYIYSRSIKKNIILHTSKEKLDKMLTHRFFGYVFLILILFIIFQFIFFVADYPMNWIEFGMTKATEYFENILPHTEWAHLIINGLIPGITGVVIFIPQIALLFLMIGILEETGYMARISFLMDKTFSRFGLSGKSLIPIVSASACAVPAILGTRTITNTKERLITIMVLPFMSCSARLPVYTMLIALIVPENTDFWFFNLKGLLLLAIYLFGFLITLLTAIIFSKLFKKEKKKFFFIELPSYKAPAIKNLLISVWNKVRIFVFNAGKIIIAISVILWFLSSHAPGTRFSDIDKKYEGNIRWKESPKEMEAKIAAEKLEASYAGILGKSIEPAIRPLGFDWKIGIALVTSFAAREVFVGTMATLYSANNDDISASLIQKIKSTRNPLNNSLVFNLATCLSLMIYYALAMQCISTMSVVYQETRSLKLVMIQFVAMTGLAYLLALITYQSLSSI